MISKFFSIAFSGDISCDFESADWDGGFCNWEYDFASKNIFDYVEASSTESAMKQRWKFGRALRSVKIVSL
jgi:hypothetical protein